ncbi:MAG: translocation/assembly module TamB domain-containing protein [Pseudomonadota bacterium]
MRWLLIPALLLATPAFAQDEPGFFERLFSTDTADSDAEQGTLLEGLIEDSLSGTGRSVTVTGFSGALSGQATLDSLVIADADGPWLTLTDATLDWNRAALFRGRLDVTELSAREILFPRLPTSEEAEAPSPEASGGFQLPDLPVSVNIGRIAAERVELGEALFGVASVISMDGALSLSDGSGAADLDITRLDQPGAIRLDAGYENATQNLRLDLSMVEAEGGIVSTLVGLPGAPSVDFAISGDAPLSDFAADIRLATDGEDRLSGQVTLRETEEARRVSANIGGDIAPVFAPQFRDFFGDSLTLEAETLLFDDGRISVPEFSFYARELALFGTVELGADRLPQLIDITGRIAPETGDRVLLPISGEPTEVERANLGISYDASQSEDWRAVIRIDSLARDGLQADEALARITGQLGTGTPASVSGALILEVDGLVTTDGLSEAVGSNISGAAQIDWNGGPLTVEDFTLTARDLSLAGMAIVDGNEITTTTSVQAARLANFSALAGRDLSGDAALSVSGQLNPLTQSFNLTAKGETNNLAIGEPRADAIVAGTATLEATVVRDTDGVRVALTTLESPAASLTGEASLRSGGSSAALTGRLNETAVIVPGLNGPSDITFAGQENETRDWTIRTSLTAPAVTADVQGLLSNIYEFPAFQGTASVESPDLSVFSELAGRALSGRIAVEAEGGVNADLTRALVDADVRGRDITVEGLDVEGLLKGPVTLSVEGGRTDDRIDITNIAFGGASLIAQLSGVITGLSATPAFDGKLSARSPDLSVFSGLVGRPLSGRANVLAEGAATADLTSGRITATLDGQDIRTGLSEIDPLLQGAVALEVDGARDGDTLSITRLSLEGPALTANLSGSAMDLNQTPSFEGRVNAQSEDISVFAGLAKRPLAGQLTLTAEGGGRSDLSDARLVASVTGENLRTGIAEADTLLQGPLSLEIDAARNGGGIEVNAFSLRTDAVTAETSGQIGEDGDRLSLTARLFDVSPFVPGFSGALAIAGTLGRVADGLALDIDATGPGGSRAAVEGTITEDFATANLGIDGSAPLALANRFIEPRSLSGTSQFNLRLDGPPNLGALSGRVTLADARLAAPTLPTGLDNITGTIQLNDSQASLNIDSRVESGGRLSVAGPIGLTAPNIAALRVGLSDVRVTDPQLYETTANGEIRISGALTGGASIAGTVNLDETNIRIPSSGLGGAGAIPEITHLREPPPVRGTRQKAGLLERENTDNVGSRAVFPLDVQVLAPNRIFVRGRGLDSEFGGSVRVTGTTANIIPIGAFELIRGRLDILGQRLALEQARITIQGGLIPILDILATTDVEDTEINVGVLGPADAPEISFTSSPELPQEEVLARLIFGRGLETLSPIQAARLAIAVRTLAGRGGEGIVGNIRGGAGLADLDVTTNEEGNAAVRAGAYLGENIYSDVTIDSSGETQLNLNLDVSPSLTVRGGVTNDGSTSLGIFFERDY